jgi:NTE family protein
MANFPFQNLVFKGGGVKGIAYIGALKALENANIIQQISGFAGTSAGAITASLASCRISSDALNNFLSTTNYNDFKDGGGILTYLNDIANHFGPYEGDYFLNSWYKAFLSQQNIDPDITFAGVKSQFGTNLQVYSTDLNSQSIQEFSAEVTPNVQIAMAVRASMSIPMFFRAWQFPDSNPNNHIFVDGGVMYNYPIDSFDHSESNTNETLGFYLTNLSGILPPPNDLTFGLSHLETYFKSLFDSLMNSQDYVVQQDEDQMQRTVLVNDFGISATDFDITPAQVQQLYNSGMAATEQFLAKF